MLASLSDGVKTKHFPLHPDKVRVSVSGEYAINSVLDTAKPLVRPKSSATVYTLDRILLYSSAGNIDFNPAYMTFKYWASAQTRLKYTSDTFNIPMCYIRSLSMTPIQWRGNKLIHAEMTMELIEAGEDSKSNKATTVAKKITVREQENKIAMIKNKLKIPTNQKLLEIPSSNFTVTVNDQNRVAILSGGTTTDYDYADLMRKIG